MNDILVLLKQAHNGDKNAREQLIKENMGLVYTVARRFPDRGCELEDLIQIGSIGLMKAIDHFDPVYEVRFSTYAVPMISGEIRRYMRDCSGMIRVSRLLKETAGKAFRIREELIRTNASEPTMQELAAACQISTEDLMMAMEAVAEVESLSQTVYSGDGSPVLLGDRIPDQHDQGEETLNRLLLAQLLQLLDIQEKELIRLRYFEDWTQVQVAEKLGMTQVQVSRAEKRILKRLRESIL